jgi:hypothetical protein
MTRALLTLTFALALLAGCGGGDDGGGSGGGGDSLSKGEFVAEANKICREGEQKISEGSKDSQAKIAQAKNEKDQRTAIADALESTAKEYDPYLERLKDLDPPQELSADWDKFVGGVSEAFDLIPDLADATRDGDRAKLKELTDKFSKLGDDTRPFAQTNKLSDCLPDSSGA